MTPPEPTRMRSVRAAIAAMSRGGLPLAMPGTAWCSATQIRSKPSSSARRARSTVSCSARAVGSPARVRERSSRLIGTGRVVTHRA